MAKLKKTVDMPIRRASNILSLIFSRREPSPVSICMSSTKTPPIAWNKRKSNNAKRGRFRITKNRFILLCYAYTLGVC